MSSERTANAFMMCDSGLRKEYNQNEGSRGSPMNDRVTVKMRVLYGNWIYGSWQVSSRTRGYEFKIGIGGGARMVEQHD